MRSAARGRLRQSGKGDVGLLTRYLTAGIVLALVPVLTYLLAPDVATRRLVRELALGVEGVLVVAAMAYGATRTRPVPPALGLLLAATTCWFGGEALTALAPLGSPAGHLGVGINLLGYLLVVRALLVVGRLHAQTTEPDSWAEAVVLVVVLGLGAWWLTSIADVFGGPSGPDVGVRIQWVLTVADMVLLGAYLRLSALVPVVAPSMRLLGASSVLLLVADALVLWHGPADEPSTTLGTSMLIASWTCFGLFALHPTRTVLHEPPTHHPGTGTGSRRVVLVSALSLVPALGLLLAPAHDLTPRGAGYIAAAMVFCFVVLLVRLVAALRRVQGTAAHLARLADRDELTGLANRRAAARAFAVVSRRRTAATTPQPLALAILDIDHFKRFNDTRGHQQGDRLLRTAAREWEHALGADVVLSRHGGEEFLVIAPGRTPDQLVRLLDAARAVTPLAQTFSAGVAAWIPGESFDALVARADTGLYLAKDRGRGLSVVVDDGRTPTADPGTRARRWLAPALAAVGALVVVGFFALGPGARPALYGTSLAAATAGIVGGPLRTLSANKRLEPWLWGLGIIWGLFAVTALAADPLLWPGVTLSTLAAIALHLIALPFVLELHAGHAGDRTAWIDAAVVVIGIVLAYVVLVETPQVRDHRHTVLGQVWVPPVYALATAVVLGVLVQAVISRRRAPFALLVLLGAAATQLLGDVALSAFPSATFPDAPWAYLQMVALVGIGIGLGAPSAVRLVRPSSRPGEARVGRLRTLLLVAVALLPGLLLTYVLVDQPGRRFPAVVVAVADIALTVLVAARLRGLLAEQQALAAELGTAVRTDPLTGLGNRRAAKARLLQVCSADDQPLVAGPAAPTWMPVGIAMIDLDHFKHYNDLFGHPAGDELLRDSARVWSDLLGPDDDLYRVGGEEFLLVAKGRSTASVEALLTTLRAAVPRGQSFSAGAASWDGIESPDHLVGRADAALYRAKGEGRARTATAEPTRRLAPVDDVLPDVLPGADAS